MKKAYLIILGIAVLLAIILLEGGKNFSIKNENNSDIKEKSAEMPDYIKEQGEAVICAFQLYQQKKAEGIQFNSQCLGSCNSYAVDIAHIPRIEEDDKAENQCKEYREGKVRHFIELDKEGNIVRIM